MIGKNNTIKSIWFLVLLAVLAPIISGCTRTVTGGCSVSPDTKYCVYGRLYGAYGHSFMSRTSKTIRISIETNNGSKKVLFQKDYKFVGSYVGWDAVWRDSTILNVNVFEYPPGANPYNLNVKIPKTNLLFTLAYALDSRMGKFTETTEQSKTSD